MGGLFYKKPSYKNAKDRVGKYGNKFFRNLLIVVLFCGIMYLWKNSF